FAPQKITLQELYQCVGMLYRSCLLVSDAEGQGIELKQRGDLQTSRQFFGTLTNILAVRFRGVDPDQFLTFLNRWFGWVFSRFTLVAVVLLWISAAALLFTQFETFTRKLPEFQDFFAAKNWVWLALTMGAAKVIHELGHGLACKKFGGQCHEMGVMFLVLTPCLYCNVSDSWTLPNKWHRATIAAAGMYVELVLAAMAVFVWWFSYPGIVNQLALNLIFVSSVSTILFNGNPLLRYDGYYILSDLIEIPNLRQKATTLLQRQMANWFMGIESRPDPFLPVRRKWFFIAYSVSAAMYRWVITFSIFWFLYSILEPYGAKVIGQFIALFAIWGLVGSPLLQAYKFFSVPGRFGTVNRGRFGLAMILVGLIVVGILSVPIPRYVRCPYIVEMAAAEKVYIEVPGQLKNVYTGLGSKIRKGQPILRLENSELDTQIIQLEEKLANTKSQCELLRRASHSIRENHEVIDDLSVSEAQLETVEADILQRQKDIEMLTITSPVDGVLIPPNWRKKQDHEVPDLAVWHGYPTEPRNVGCYLEQSTVVGEVVPDITKMEAVLVVDQSEIEFVKNGQSVLLFPDSLPGQTIKSSVDTIAVTKMKTLPQALSSRFGGDIVAIQNGAGDDKPQSATFQVGVPFSDELKVISAGSIGKAKINAGTQTIGQRIWRAIQATFRFDL
ncbi:MAG: site-2 protease family protein, partial [Planctomycetota bacterium]